MSLAALTDRQSSLQRIYNIEVSAVGPQTRFASPKTRHLYDWWAAANGGGVPLKRQFDITEHAAIAPNVFLVRCAPDGGFEFRLHGEDVICMMGRNHAARVTADSPGNYGHALDEYYGSIVAERVCKLCSGSLSFAERGFWRFESLDCPLSSDGTHVDHIIGVMDRIA